MSQQPRFVVLVSANTEWRVMHDLFPDVPHQHSPLGKWFSILLTVHGQIERVIFFHGGWGKIAAAASAQYVIDRWSPQLLVNLGTCGGFRGEIERGEIVLAEKTLVYDIIEQMTDPQLALDHYTTILDLAWLSPPYPHPVQRTLLVSGDRDIVVDDIPHLRQTFGAVAADWESGAIAYVAGRNGLPCLILRGVSDLVGPDGGDAYAGQFDHFEAGARAIMTQLCEALPEWLDRFPR